MEKRSYVKKGDDIIGIVVETVKGDSFIIPVADVRVNRKRAEQILKASRIQQGSKFMRPSYSLMGYKY